MARSRPGQPPPPPAGPTPEPGPAPRPGPARKPVSDAEKAFGERLRNARVAAGWNQTMAARELGIPPSRLAEYEKGQRTPPVLRLVEIVDRLGLDPSILFPHWWPKENP